MADYRIYEDDYFNEQVFTVFIAHGHSEDWRKVERFVNKKLDFDTIVVQENYKPGDIIEKKVEKNIRKCECVVAILSPDDKMVNGTFRARQNVIYELGLSRKYLKKKQIILLVESSVEVQSDIAGLIYIPYKNETIETTFTQLGEGLEKIFNRFDEEGCF
jgi:predicted nucleotide-binding protein